MARHEDRAVLTRARSRLAFAHSVPFKVLYQQGSDVRMLDHSSFNEAMLRLLFIEVNVARLGEEKAENASDVLLLLPPAQIEAEDISTFEAKCRKEIEYQAEQQAAAAASPTSSIASGSSRKAMKRAQTQQVRGSKANI
mmetsp:Transcript_39710/g.79373  ORF Transcript_39710/g.79373 Transcript_39710/m.79373 type:complete len:139 (+) Transcript_39710:1041-1457(+)